MVTDFSLKNPEEILKEGDLGEYQLAMTDFHLRLAGLHTDLFIVQKIIDFPFNLFTTFEDGFFFSPRCTQFFPDGDPSDYEDGNGLSQKHPDAQEIQKLHGLCCQG